MLKIENLKKKNTVLSFRNSSTYRQYNVKILQDLLKILKYGVAVASSEAMYFLAHL